MLLSRVGLVWQPEVRSPEFDFLVCCGCLLSWASLFPSFCLSFFLCNIMLMSLCCIWALSVELGWRDRQGPTFSLPVGSDCLWWWKTVFICICLLADAQTSFMPCTWVDGNWENLEFLVSPVFCMEDCWARGISDGPMPMGITGTFSPWK